jgi:hypothetical protein
MNIAHRLLACFTVCIFMANAYPETLKKVYLDSKRNVHIITTHDRDSRITSKGKRAR